MKQFATIFIAAIFSSNLAHAMTRVDAPASGSEAPTTPSNPAQQSGKVSAIFAGAGKIVIGGVTYAYNPLSTVVTINGKRATISDVRTGDTAQFQLAPQGAHKTALVTTLTVERR